jgi:hypothetical protein
MRIRLTQSARKRRIGRVHFEAAMSNAHTVETVPATELTDPQIVWIGEDDRGDELEVIAVVLPNELLIIHVMPTRYKRST